MYIYFKSKSHQILISILLVVLPISSSLCIDMYLPAYPDIAKNFAIPIGSVNFSMSIYLIGLAIGQLIYGPFSDKFGRKKFLIFGLSLFSIASLVCFITPSFTFFLVARFLQAIGACSCIVLARAIVTDIFHPEKRTKILALISASNIFSPALAPLLGGYMAFLYNWRDIFLVITIFGLIMLMFISLFFEESLKESNQDALKISNMLNNILRLFRNRTFLGYILCIGFLSDMVFTWVTYAPEVLINTFGISENRFGMFFLVPAIGSTLGALFTAKFTSKLGERKLIIIGICAVVFGTVSLWVQTSGLFNATSFTIIASIMFAFFGTGVSVPQLISGAIAPFVDIAGFTSGIIGFIQTTSSSLSGLITSLHYSSGYKIMGLLMLTASVLATCSFLINLIRPTRQLVIFKKKKALVKYDSIPNCQS